MIGAAFLAGALLLAQATLLPAPSVLTRYAAAIDTARAPKVVIFEYILEQAGVRNGEQVHRVFRDGDDERDELLSIDGKKLTQPKVNIYRGRRDRYRLPSLAPRPDFYTFLFIGTRAGGRQHLEYVFETTPRYGGDFWVTQVAIDGVTFVPTAIAFKTRDHDGSGTVSFAPNGRWWVPTQATARATFGRLGATERISFVRYRFPDELPASTFSGPRSLPPAGP